MAQEFDKPNANDFLPLLYKIAMKKFYELPVKVKKKVQVEELQNAGFLGLTEAIKKFDPAQKKTFVYYVGKNIEWAIDDFLRIFSGLKKNQWEDVKKVRAKRDELEQILNREPDNKELADVLNWTINKVIEVRELDKTEISIDDKKTDENGDEYSEIPLMPDEKSIDEEIKEKETSTALNECLENALNKNEKNAILLNKVQKISMREIAKIIGYKNIGRVNYLIDRAKEKLKDCLKSRGIEL